MKREIDAFLDYLKHEKNASPHTISSYERDLKQLSLYLEERNVSLRRTDNVVLRGFLATLYDKRDKKSTVARKLAAIRSFFQFCIRKRWLEDNPAKVVATPKQERHVPSFLSEAFSDLYAQDGLVVLGRGLGWLSLLAAFVRYYGDPECNGVNDIDEDDSVAEAAVNTKTSLPPPKYSGDDINECKTQKKTPTNSKKPPLIFVLNLRDNERQVLFSTLTSWKLVCRRSVSKSLARQAPTSGPCVPISVRRWGAGGI